MPAESLSFDITAHDNASRKFRDVGDAALSASAKMDIASASAKLWSDTAIKQGKAADTSTAAMKTHMAATALLADAENVLAGKATTTTKLMADQGRELDTAGKKAESAAKSFGGLAGTGAGIPGGGIGALIGAGVALSPVIATLSVGLTGLAVAAYGIAKPIENAAKKTGGLSANLKLLDPEQRQVAKGILALGASYGTFQTALKPEILGLFNTSLRIAGHLLHDVQPVADATGHALNGVLAGIDKEFQSGTWQQFFGFMARTAAPDVQRLGQTFIDLMHALPPLLQMLQPVATDVLAIADGFAKLTAQGAQAGQSMGQTAHHENVLAQTTDLLRTALFAPGKGLYAALKLTGVIGATAGTQLAGTTEHVHHLGQTAADLIHPLGAANHGLAAAGVSAKYSTVNLQAMTAQVTALNTAESKSLDTQLAYSNALITGAADADALRKALKASHDQVGLHTAAERASFTAANTYISDLENTAKQAVASGKGASGAAQAIRNGLPILEQAAAHNRRLWQEVQTLKDWLDKLRREGPISEKINVLGLGKWSVAAAGHAIAQGPGPFAAGGRITAGTTPTADDVLIRASRNETVLSAAHSAMLAPLLKQIGVPGYAAGGLVGSYGGNVAGLVPWSRGDLNATAHLIDLAVVKATLAGISAAASAAQSFGAAGPGGGAPAANAALARRMFPGEDFAAWNYVAMRESGWNQFARNPSSGAYGIAQALPPTKYPFAGQAAGGSNPAAQISWMEGYMRSRYGGAAGAAAHERAFNWYDQGGWLPPGLSLALNTTGKPERVGGSAGGVTINHLTITLPPGSDREQGRRIVSYIRSFEQGSGSGWRR